MFKKLLFVLFMLILYRVGTYVPLPGVNGVLLNEVVKNNSGGMLAMFNMLTGGALGRLSIFALNIMPYITASIVMQMMSVVSKDIAAMKKEGMTGRRKINQYTKYLALTLALFQGFSIAVGAESIEFEGRAVIDAPGLYFRLVAALNLAGGTMFVIWITDQITARGVGNGTSLVIFSGIVAGIPSSISSMLEMGRSGAISMSFIFFVFLGTLSLILLIVFIEKAQRRVVINYPRRQVGNRMLGGENSYIPLKINTPGVIAPIFASSILLLPTTVLGFAGGNYDVGTWQYYLLSNLSHGKFVYILLYALFIIFFSFFYTTIVFNADETAENLRKGGGIILGRRPGAQTADYLNYVLLRITAVGALYITFVCALPEVVISRYSIPLYLGGTSLLIMVNVVIDMMQQVQLYIIDKYYSKMFNGKHNFMLR